MTAIHTNGKRSSVPVFLLLTLAFSAVFYFLIIHTGKIGSGFNLYVTGLMWSPGLAALLTIKITRGNYSELGWKWPQWKYIRLSYWLPVVYALLAYILIWAAGWGRFYEEEYFRDVVASFGYDKLPTWISIVLFVFFLGIYGMARASASALGEEIGWRGFLVPALYTRFGFTKTSLLTGLIWSLWHYPILLFADYNSGTPAWYGLSCFTVLVITMSFAYTWLRMKSKSLWPAVVLHAAHNLYIQRFFTPMTADTGRTGYYIDEFGIVLPVISVFLAFYFWRRRRELSDK